jgi:hypothetical protein
MEKERSMEEYCVPPALQEFPQLKQLPCVSLQNHYVIVAYLAYLGYFCPTPENVKSAESAITSRTGTPCTCSEAMSG